MADFSNSTKLFKTRTVHQNALENVIRAVLSGRAPRSDLEDVINYVRESHLSAFLDFQRISAQAEVLTDDSGLIDRVEKVINSFEKYESGLDDLKNFLLTQDRMMLNRGMDRIDAASLELSTAMLHFREAARRKNIGSARLNTLRIREKGAEPVITENLVKLFEHCNYILENRLDTKDAFEFFDLMRRLVSAGTYDVGITAGEADTLSEKDARMLKEFLGQYEEGLQLIEQGLGEVEKFNKNGNPSGLVSGCSKALEGSIAVRGIALMGENEQEPVK